MIYKETCLRCGWCCRHVFDVIALRKNFDDGSGYAVMIDEFPYRKEADGYCEKYDRKTGRCRVYKDRPTLCDSRKMLNLINASKDERRRFYEIQGDLCRYRAETQKDKGAQG